MNFSIFTAYPRGYCAGVQRAVGMLMDIVKTYPAPIYVNHEIIHNRYVVQMFERQGVVFEPDISSVPEGSLVVISAHGTGPSYFKKLRERNIQWIDATCPLVEKVHREALQYIDAGYHILYIGKSGHQEALGVIDEGADTFTLIENETDVSQFSPQEGIQYAILTQTTLAVDDTAILIKKLQEKIPDIVLPKAGDICYATTNRQMAVKKLAEACDLVLVVGSKNSSNSSKLRYVAEALGKPAYLIDDASEVDPQWLDRVSSVGVTAGASGPENLVEQLVEHLGSLGGVFTEELRVVEEKMKFPYTLTVRS